MTLHEYITENRKIINTLFKAGLITTTIINQYQIHKYYTDAIADGNKASMAIEMTAIRFRLTGRSVFTALSRMEENV